MRRLMLLWLSAAVLGTGLLAGLWGRPSVCVGCDPTERFILIQACEWDWGCFSTPSNPMVSGGASSSRSTYALEGHVASSLLIRSSAVLVAIQTILVRLRFLYLHLFQYLYQTLQVLSLVWRRGQVRPLRHRAEVHDLVRTEVQ